MRGVEMAERAEGFEDRGREREREGAEIFAGRPAEDEGFAIDGLAVGEAVDGELAPGRVLEELEERSALLLDEGEEDGGGDFGAGGPERVQLGEDRRVGEREGGGVVGEAHREAQRVGGQQGALGDESSLLVAETARHRPRGRREDFGRGPVAEGGEGGEDVEGVHVASLTVQV